MTYQGLDSRIFMLYELPRCITEGSCWQGLVLDALVRGEEPLPLIRSHWDACN